jgi:hypothetical protein
MSAKDGFEGELLDHLFLNIPIAGIGDSNGILGSVSAGNFHIVLYKVAPTDAGQGTECDYIGYSRVSVPRNASGFVRLGNNISNAAAITFGQCVSGTTQTAVSFTVNKGAATGVDDAIVWGALSTPLDVSVGVTPEFAIGDLDVNVD